VHRTGFRSYHVKTFNRVLEHDPITAHSRRNGALKRTIREMTARSKEDESNPVWHSQSALGSVRIGVAATLLLLAGCAPGAFFTESGPTRGSVVSGAR